MGLNILNKDTYHLVDDNGFMINQNELKNPDVLKKHDDVIGHNLDGFFAYDHKPFIDVIKECYVEKEDNRGKYIQGYRSPYHVKADDSTMSRYHTINTLILMKYINDPFLKKLSKNLRWKISNKYSFTIDSWLWMKGISGNKFQMFLYYLIDIPFTFLSIMWNKAIYKLGKFGKELPQSEFILIPEDQISKKQKKLRKLAYPMYALYIKAFTLYVSPKSIGKTLLKRICLMGTDKQNFLLRIMFGGKVNETDIYSYKPMYSGRWTTWLNNLNDRNVKIIENEIHKKENCVDSDLLIKIYRKSKYKYIS